MENGVKHEKATIYTARYGELRDLMFLNDFGMENKSETVMYAAMLGKYDMLCYLMDKC